MTISAPETPTAPLERYRVDDLLADRARRLRAALVDVLPCPASEIAVRVTSAVVEDEDSRDAAGVAWRTKAGGAVGGDSSRTIRARFEAAQARVGPSRDFPRWSRVAPLGPSPGSLMGQEWPAGWLAAAAREVAGWDSRLPWAPGPEIGAGRAIRLDPFALADLLRAASLGWLTLDVPPPARVASRAVTIENRSPWRGVDQGGSGGDAGPPLGGSRWEPRVPVRGGLLVARPGPEAAFRASWRERPAPAWGSLWLAAPAIEPPSDGPIVTRVQIVGGQVLTGGWVARGGRPTARFVDLRGPEPSRWLEGIAGSLGEPVADLTGPPVSCPPVLVRLG